ncbi:MAG: hypothetical protein AAF541_21240 [Pseudomonadota bacterium]
MNLLIVLLYLTTAAAFVSQSVDLNQVLGPAGRVLKISPDLLAAMLFAATMVWLGRTKSLAMPGKYLVLGVILLLHMVVGAIINQVSPGAFVWGVRVYFAFIPLFILPLVYRFSDLEIQRYLVFVLGLCLMQLPVALYQRIFVYPYTPTGDVVRGTFQSGAIMSIVLVMAVGIMLALQLRGKISLKTLLIVAPIMLIPTLINETKGTVVLLPIVLTAVAFFHAEAAKRIKLLFISGIASVMFILTFTVAYDVYFPDRGNEGDSFKLIKFFTDEALGDLYKDLEEPKPGRVGRVDSILYALQELDKDPVKVAVGLGIGNVSHPETMDFVKGEYGDLYEYYGAATTTYASVLWTTGVMGVLFTLLILWCMYRDTSYLRNRDSYTAAIALGFSSVAICLPVAFLYKDLVYSNVANVLGLFLAGYIVSERVRIQQNERSRMASYIVKRQPNRPLNVGKPASIPGVLQTRN